MPEEDRRILAVSATEGPICSIGFLKPKRFLGPVVEFGGDPVEVLGALWMERSVPFGKYCAAGRWTLLCLSSRLGRARPPCSRGRWRLE